MKMYWPTPTSTTRYREDWVHDKNPAYYELFSGVYSARLRCQRFAAKYGQADLINDDNSVTEYRKNPSTGGVDVKEVMPEDAIIRHDDYKKNWGNRRKRLAFHKRRRGKRLTN